MIHTATKTLKSKTLQNHSQLVSLLTQLSETKLKMPEYNLAQHVGHMVGVTGAMKLAHGLRQISSINTEKETTQLGSIEEDILSTRELILRRVVESFLDSKSESTVKLPSEKIGMRAEALESFSPYQRFYGAKQLEIINDIDNLRLRVRVAIAASSPTLHQLALLDQILSDSLDDHTRGLYNVIPKVLEHRFKQYKEAADTLDKQTWLLPFYNEMRELLIAEVDQRLQPVLGLFEALNEQLDMSYD